MFTSGRLSRLTAICEYSSIPEEPAAAPVAEARAVLDDVNKRKRLVEFREIARLDTDGHLHSLAHKITK